MQAGKLRHRVSFETLESVLDSDDGIVDEEWTPAFNGTALWASVEPLSGRELIAAASIQSKVSTRMVLRWREGFKASMRATHDGVTYNIEAVIPDPMSRRQWVTLLCSSGVNEG